ncbi:MAG: tetratricopeptide repeat protein [Lacibacter sp.]
MKRSLSLVFLAIVCVQQIFAQSLEEGKKFMYYERFNSAKDVFAKLLAANPANAEAAYWLGQAYIGLEDDAAVKKAYQTGLQSNPTSPLLLSGMGQIELTEGKTADARNHFDMALNSTKFKDIEVLKAVARANAYANAGDANYAIAQMQKATTLKGFKDPEVYIIMGDAYRKLIDGGNAVLAFKNALAINPTMASAKYREGRIYESQKNTEFFLGAYEEAIKMDPNYGPAYYSLYVYWYFRDVSKAEGYLNKYISVIDADPQNDYYTIDLKYAAQKYGEAISMSDALISKVGPDVIKPRIYRLKAYSYFKLNDYANAKASVDDFFKKAHSHDIVPKDYELYGDIMAITPGSESKAYDFYDKAIYTDTIFENKVEYVQKAVDLAKKQKDIVAVSDWLAKQYSFKKSPSNVDLYNLGRSYFDAGSVVFPYYKKADSCFAIYTEKYPDQAYGYYWRGRSNWSIDTSMANGMANPHFEKFIEVATTSKDSATFKGQIKVAYKYFIGYNVFVTKDYKKAIEFCDKILAIDPADKDADNYKRQLTGGKQQSTGTAPAGGSQTKPATNKPGSGAAPKK